MSGLLSKFRLRNLDGCQRVLRIAFAEVPRTETAIPIGTDTPIEGSIQDIHGYPIAIED